jgi:hypothetical protein
MHIEPGIVHGAKMALALVTAAGAAGMSVRLIAKDLLTRPVVSLTVRSLIATLVGLLFFEVFPHVAVGVSEVHFILGTSLLLILGVAPAAVGLAGALALQGLLFAPSDLPMYAVNVTTLLLPLFAIRLLARTWLRGDVAYVDLGYKDVLKLSATYQGGVIAWVAFWVIYGQGIGAETLASLITFALAYAMVIIVEPLIDLALLAGARSAQGLRGSGLVESRLYHPV